MNVGHSRVHQAALDLARPILAGRTILLTGPAAKSPVMAKFFTDAGANAVPVDLSVNAEETRDRFVTSEQILARPGERIRGLLDSKDPTGTALLYAGSFTAVPSVCGRKVIGARSRRHLDAERKDMQRALFGLAGRVVDLGDALEQATGPVVVQGIPDDGVAMATSHTYLVPRSAGISPLRRLMATLSRDCRRVVITPYTAGLPCTFYGFIGAEAVVDFGAVEALVCWDSQTWRIHAPGILRPAEIPEPVLSSARATVHQIGQHLHDELGYVGAFGTDGVIVDGTYEVHDVNPRICAGFSLLDQLVPDAAPLSAVDLMVRERTAAAAALATAVAELATSVQRDPTLAYRLWDAPDLNLPVPEDQRAHQSWAQRIRRTAAGRRQLIRELEDIHP